MKGDRKGRGFRVVLLGPPGRSARRLELPRRSLVILAVAVATLLIGGAWVGWSLHAEASHAVAPAE